MVLDDYLSQLKNIDDQDKLLSSISALITLYKVSTIINSSLELNEVLSRIMNSVTDVVEAEAGSILLIDEETGNLFFEVATGEKGEEVKKFEIEMGEGIAGWVAQTGEVLLVPDATKDSRHLHEVSEKIKFDTKSILCVPLKLDGVVIGVVEVINKINKPSFTEDDIPILNAFANQAAIAIGNAKLYGRVRDENKDLSDLKETLAIKHDIIGKSRKMEEVYEVIKKVSKSKASVLLRGDSGTGKELVARAIHRNSPRKEGPFVAVSCAALSENLLESELFGHEKGAFTGAISRKPGKFELADGGTVFLDEVGDISPSLQIKLLRVLQEREFERVGGTKTIKVDVRIIAATNKNLERAIEEGAFRDDLYYRLNVVPIHLPPLRERKDDILLLVDHFLRKYSKEMGKNVMRITPEATDMLLSYDWPGNVRELENVIERAVVLGENDMILPEHIPDSLKPADNGSIHVGQSFEESQRSFKRQFLLKTLIHTNWNQSQAAKILKIQRTYLSRLIKELDIKRT
jgi:Nif-specific regulatory protein